MDAAILTLEIRYEHDVVLARQRSRQIAALLDFEGQDQVRIATAVSEITRNVYSYAGRGSVEFRIDGKTPPQVLVVQITDHGPGIRNLPEILAGQYRSATGMGLGILGARRLMDRCDIESAPGRTVVRLKKILPRAAPLVNGPRLAALAADLARQVPQNPFEEVQQQNQELIRTMDELKRRQDELVRLNHELEDTNRGVLALYAELDEKADHLRRADEMKSRFLSNMSHEFRTPLNSIMALARILQDRTDGELTAEQEKQVGFIRKAAEDLTELVNDLLDLAKVEAGRIDINPTEFEVGALFGALRGMLRPLLVGESVRLVFEDPSGIPTIFGDEGKVSQILRNFLSNALKFTESGEIRVSAAMGAQGDTVVLTVADTGIGIAPEDQQRIFGEFQQVDHALQRRIKGTGLGLSLSKKLAELMQGRIGVDSTPGIGSRFFVEIPLVFRPPASEDVVEPAQPEPDPLRLPVLIVEDSPEAMEIYESLLRGTEFQVFSVTTTQAARQALRELEPKALILDIQLRGQDSWAYLAELKNGEYKDLPVLVVTNVDDEAKALSLGADAYFAKPVERPWLLQSLRNLTHARRRASVLIVDDDELSRYTLAAALRNTHFEILEASDGEQGVTRARTEHPSAILLDLHMPVLDGFGALERLKADPSTRDIPVIVVTSLSPSPADAARLGQHTVAVLSKESVARGKATEEIRALLLDAERAAGASGGGP